MQIRESRFLSTLKRPDEVTLARRGKSILNFQLSEGDVEAKVEVLTLKNMSEQ